MTREMSHTVYAAQMAAVIPEDRDDGDDDGQGKQD